MNQKVEVVWNESNLFFIFLESKFENVASNFLIFCAKIFHECSCYIHIWKCKKIIILIFICRKTSLQSLSKREHKFLTITRPLIFSTLFEYSSSWWGSFTPSAKSHIMNITLDITKEEEKKYMKIFMKSHKSYWHFKKKSNYQCRINIFLT